MSDILTAEIKELTLDDAINVVNGREHNQKLSRAEIFFTKRLGERLSLEEKGETYYYLLRCKLERNSLYETPDMLHLYQKMHEYFSDTEEEYKAAMKDQKMKVIANMQLKAFYNLASYYFGSLEQIYLLHNFVDSARLAYEDRMHFRKNLFFHSKSWIKWLGYKIVEITSNYGNSFLRWGMTSAMTVITFATLFILSDATTDLSQRMIGHEGKFYDYFYYSIVTFTTLGYGEIVPIIGVQKLLASLEVVFGYFMLGMFINLMNRKL